MAQLCNTVTVKPENISVADLYSVNATSPGPNQILVEFEVQNVLTSGLGEKLSPTASILVDGEEKAKENFTFDPGEVYRAEITFEGIEAGNKNVCVEV